VAGGSAVTVAVAVAVAVVVAVGALAAACFIIDIRTVAAVQHVGGIK
jgi:hypothetical protein